MNRVSIVSDNTLSLFGAKPIYKINAGLLSIGPLATKFSEILIKYKIFDAFENFVCKLATILSSGKSVIIIKQLKNVIWPGEILLLKIQYSYLSL